MGSFARQNFTSTPIRFSFDRWRQYLDKYARLFRQFCECTSTNMRMYFDNMRDCFDNLSVRLGQLGQVRLGQVWLGQVRLGQVRFGQVWLGLVRLSQVRLGQVWLGLVRLSQVWLGYVSQVKPGKVRLLSKSSRIDCRSHLAIFSKFSRNLSKIRRVSVEVKFCRANVSIPIHQNGFTNFNQGKYKSQPAKIQFPYVFDNLHFTSFQLIVGLHLHLSRNFYIFSFLYKF